MSKPTVRPFDPDDTDSCYSICLRTAANGADATHLHTDPRIVGEIWVGPYLVRHPECAFVAEDEEGVGGYIVGAPDTADFDRWAEEVWFPRLREKYPLGTFAEGTADAACAQLIHSPPRMPEGVIAAYPAHLHVDLVPRLQGHGLGRRLLEALFAACHDAGADAIHLGCSPENRDAIAFYRRLGFADVSGGVVWGRSTEPLR